MISTKQVDTPVTVPTPEEQEQVVGGAAVLTLQPRPNLKPPPELAERAIPAPFDPHPPILRR